MTDETSEFAPTADRARRAMTEHADRVEVSDDAYARIATRVAAADRADRGVRSWLPTPMTLAAGAAAVAVVVGAVAVIDRPEGDDGGVSVAAAPTEDPATSSTAPDSTVAEPGDEGAGGGESGDDEDDGEGTRLGTEAVDSFAPVRSTPIEAAEAFLDLLDVEPAQVAVVDGVHVVRTAREGGSEFDFDVATLELLELDDGAGWTVTSATSDGVRLDAPQAGAVTDGEFTIVGAGRGFEGALDVEIRSALDGSPLLMTYTQGGSLADLEPFEVGITMVGTERAWVVVRSSGGADGVALPFAAVPVTIEAGPSPAPWVVTSVAVDDADGGLNLRAGPGAGNDKIAVLAWGDRVTRTPGLFPTAVGDDIWWPVTAADGNDGWVNARFLAAGGELDGQDSENVVSTFFYAAVEPAFAGPWFPLSGQVGFTVVSEGETARFEADELFDPAGWDRPAIDGRSLSELLSVPPTGFPVEGDELTIADAETQLIADRYFGGLPGASVDYVGEDGVSRLVHLFVEVGAVGPRYVGVIVEAGAG